MTTPITSIDQIPDYSSVGSLKRHLSINGCRLCSLGFQPEINGCCVARGSETSNKMLIGEAPGKEEDSTGTPFSGPAGRLMDDIWGSVGMNTNDWYITNTVLCRPYSPRGSGKENFTPKQDQRQKCKIYLDKQIDLIKPRTIVTIGAIATAAILNNNKPIAMGDYRGKLVRESVIINPGIHGYTMRRLVFPMIHPAAILHSKGNEEKYNMYRQFCQKDIQELKRILIEENI